MITCTLKDKKYAVDFISGRALREMEPAAKMLRVSMRPLFADHTVSEGFFSHDIMTRRPEQLTIKEFVELTNMVEAELATI